VNPSRNIKLVVYTAVFGGYDMIRAPRERSPGVDYVCFTDSRRPVPEGWTRADLPSLADPLSPASRNRWAKMHPHLLFSDHDASLYVDGNIDVIGDVAALAQRAIDQGPLSMYDHPFRRCLYDEAVTCARVGLDWLAPIRRHVERYAREGFPRHAGLYEANVIVRRHHEPLVVRAMDRWWAEWQSGIKRDQLSLTYALWREGLPVHSLGQHDPRFVQHYFIYRAHRHPWRGLPQRLLRRYVNRTLLYLGGEPALGIKRQAPAG
jgi:hypothetical protein